MDWGGGVTLFGANNKSLGGNGIEKRRIVFDKNDRRLAVVLTLFCQSNTKRAVSLIAGHHDFFDCVSFSDTINDRLPFDHLAENGVQTIEPGARNVSNKKLRTIGIRTRVRHRKNTGTVMFQGRMEFVFKLIAGTTGSVADRTAPLNHKVGDDTVERKPIVKALLGKFLEVSTGLRRFVTEEV